MEEPDRTEDAPGGDEAEGAKNADNPQPGKDEGGLGTQTDAAGGGEPIEPRRTSDEE